MVFLQFSFERLGFLLFSALHIMSNVSCLVAEKSAIRKLVSCSIAEYELYNRLNGWIAN